MNMTPTVATSVPLRVDAGTDQLDVSVRDGIATVVLNNPGHRNALSRSMVRALPRVLNHLAGNQAVRVVVLRGAAVAACYASEDFAEGQRAFLAKRAPRFTGR